MSQQKLVVGITEMPQLEPNTFQDGYYEVRHEINHLLATVKALALLLPESERWAQAGSRHSQ
jgi:hypothetical protein